jgi:hypothetical protein
MSPGAYDDVVDLAVLFSGMLLAIMDGLGNMSRRMMEAAAPIHWRVSLLSMTMTLKTQ